MVARRVLEFRIAWAWLGLPREPAHSPSCKSASFSAGGRHCKDGVDAYHWSTGAKKDGKWSGTAAFPEFGQSAGGDEVWKLVEEERSRNGSKERGISEVVDPACGKEWCKLADEAVERKGGESEAELGAKDIQSLFHVRDIADVFIYGGGRGRVTTKEKTQAFVLQTLKDSGFLRVESANS